MANTATKSCVLAARHTGDISANNNQKISWQCGYRASMIRTPTPKVHTSQLYDNIYVWYSGIGHKARLPLTAALRRTCDGEDVVLFDKRNHVELVCLLRYAEFSCIIELALEVRVWVSAGITHGEEYSHKQIKLLYQRKEGDSRGSVRILFTHITNKERTRTFIYSAPTPSSEPLFRPVNEVIPLAFSHLATVRAFWNITIAWPCKSIIVLSFRKSMLVCVVCLQAKMYQRMPVHVASKRNRLNLHDRRGKWSIKDKIGRRWWVRGH